MDLIYSVFENHGLLVLLVIVFISQLGVPAGSTFFLMWYGSTINSSATLFVAVATATCAAVLGDITAYAFGRRFSSQLNHAENRYPWLAKKSKQSHKLLERFGGWIIWLSRFLVTGLGPFVNYVLGSKQYTVRKFFLWVSLGEIIFTLELLYFGFHFKDSWEDLLGLISDIGWLIALLIVLFFLTKKLFFKR